MARHNVYDYGPPGRPKVPVKPEPPRDFSHLNALMLGLDVRGWYRELAKRRRCEDLKANPPPFKKGRPIRDPLEMDRIMCRTEVVAECKDETDLKVAQSNRRIVLEITQIVRISAYSKKLVQYWTRLGSVILAKSTRSIGPNTAF